MVGTFANASGLTALGATPATRTATTEIPTVAAFIFATKSLDAGFEASAKKTWLMFTAFSSGRYGSLSIDCTDFTMRS
jgi:hypothetical protein